MIHEKIYRCCKMNFSHQGFASHRRFKHVRIFEDLKKDKTRREWLIRERGRKCEVCKLQRWQHQKIPLELDHIDGNPENNLKENLRIICPNCHAQTETYKGRNVGKIKNSKRQQIMKKYQGKYR